MTVNGSVKNGVVILQAGASLPDGTQVQVRAVKKPGRRPAQPSGRRKLLRHAGKVKGLPADAARNLDHYLYGHERS